MQPFDIEKARKGAAICTRDGRPAEIRAILNTCFVWRVHALVTMHDGSRQVIRYMAHGREFGHHSSPNDLFIVDEKSDCQP